MKHAWRSFLAPLTPGVRIILCVLTAMYALALGGYYSGAFDLYRWLGLTGPGFWSGRVWTLVTYALVPGGIMDFVFNSIFILFLGAYLERVWSRRQLWFACLVSIVGAGVAKVLVQPSSPAMMVGTAPVVFGLLAAWGWLFAFERVLFWFIWEMSVRLAAVLMALISFIAMVFCPCVGPVNAAIMLCGGVAAMVHLWLHQRLLRARPSRTVTNERMGRLEL